MFFLHFLTPVLAIAMFIVGSNEYNFKLKENLIGLIPLGIYSVVYVTNAVVLHTWSDFYGFTFGGKNYLVPLVLVIMYSSTYCD